MHFKILDSGHSDQEGGWNPMEGKGNYLLKDIFFRPQNKPCIPRVEGWFCNILRLQD